MAGETEMERDSSNSLFLINLKVRPATFVWPEEPMLLLLSSVHLWNSRSELAEGKG